MVRNSTEAAWGSAETTAAEKPAAGPLNTLARLALWAAGLAFIVFAFLDPRFRDGEGILSGSVCLPLAAGLALAVCGATVAGVWRRFGLWLALTLLGQAATLQLIDAGRRIHYQHYLPLDGNLFQNHLVPLLIVTAQAAIAGTAFVHYRKPFFGWIRANFRPWTLFLIGAGFTLSSTAASADPAMHVQETIFGTILQAVNLVTLLMAAASLPAAGIPPWKARLECWIASPKLPAVAALWVFSVAALLSYFVYQNHPHVPDEVAYLYHAQALAAGHLSVPAPAVPQAFEMYLIDVKDGAWFASPPPGWPALLALGWLADVPWLVNPLLAGINMLLVWELLRKLCGRRSAALGLLLLATSPWHVFMAMNFMTHTFTLFCVLAAAWAILRCRETDKAAWAWAAGAATGVGSLIRPLDGVIAAAVLGLWMIGVGGRRMKYSSIAGFVLATGFVGVLVFHYNQYLTGKPTSFPLNVYLDRVFGEGRNALGFGSHIGFDFGGLDAFPGHGIADVIVNAKLNTFSLNVELFGWAAGSLLLILLLVFSGRLERRDWRMLGIIGLVVGTFSLYWYSGGPDFGARYWYLMLIPLIVLAIRSINFLENSVSAQNRARVLGGVLILCALTAVNYFPWRAIDKYYHYLNMRPDIRELAQQRDFQNSLVLIRGWWHPDYASAWIYNPLYFNYDAPLYISLESIYAAHWKSDRADELVKAYPDRKIWLVDGPSITKAGYRLRGEISPEELLDGRFSMARLTQ